MKAILEFDLPEEQEAFKDAQNGTKYAIIIDEVWNRLFRPRHKHGYANPEIEKLMQSKQVCKLLDLLEEEYRALTKEYQD